MINNRRVSIEWKKSSYSSARGEECVEVSRGEHQNIYIRDSAVSGSEVIFCKQSEWVKVLKSIVKS